MNNRIRKGFLIALVMVLAVALPLHSRAMEETIETIKEDEVHQGDRFFGGKSLTNEGTITGDLFIGSETFTSEGAIGGDIFGGGRYVSILGPVEGSVFYGGENIKVTGTTRNVRIIGKNLVVTGDVSHNAMAFGETVSFANTINGSLIAGGKTISVDSTIKRKTRIFGKDIVLEGEYFGDVLINDINIDDIDENEDFRKEFSDSEITLTVKPGTVIHGVLRFRGTRADISEDAEIKDFQWIKPEKTEKASKPDSIDNAIWNFIRMVAVTAVLFLLGILLHGAYPAAYARLGDMPSREPGSTAGAGFIGILSVVPAAMIFIFLMVLSPLVTPAFGLIFALVATAVYVTLFYFSVIPAGIWLGNLILKERTSLYARFLAGLIVINSVVFLFSLLKELHIAEGAFSFLLVITRFAVIIIGSGAIILAVKGALRGSKGHVEKNDTEMVDKP